MKNNIKISIVVPFYNSAKTIARCLESVLAQDYNNFEVLMIDDGSVDESVDIIKNYNDRRVEVFKRKHLGVSAARNFGIKKATGDYIMFLDSDDTLDDHALTTLIRQIYRNAKYDEMIIKFNYNVIKNKQITTKSMLGLSNKILDSHNNKDFELLADKFFRNKYTIPCFVYTLFLPRKLLVKNNLYFDETKYMMEDAILYLDMMERGIKFYFYDKALYNVYENENSVTRSDENTLKIAKGIAASAHEILSRIGYTKKGCLKYFMLISGYMLRYIWFKRKINEYFFSNEILYIVQRVDARQQKVFWKLTRKAILGKNRGMLKFLAGIYNIKRRIKK